MVFHEAIGGRPPRRWSTFCETLPCATLAVWLGLAVVITGCKQSPYELVPVCGTISIDGQPLSAGRVMFAPIARGDGLDAGKPAFGNLQPDGSFVLSTYQDNDGAIAGDHWVTIFGPKQGADGTVPGGPTDLPAFSRYTVRQKQSVAADQENRIDIAIRSQDIARFATQ